MHREDNKHRKIAEDVLKKSTKYNSNVNSYSSSHAMNPATNPSKQQYQNQNQNPNKSSTGLPPLTPEEHHLLFETSGCLKCCKLFTDHISRDCKDGTPNHANYKTITSADIDAAKKHACSQKGAKPVASITDLDSGNDEPTIHPVAAIMGTTSFPLSGPAPNKTCILRNNSFDSEESVSNHISPLPSFPPIVIVL
jgi:hypothetical protein